MENLKCLFSNFPWDIFLFWALPMLLLGWWLMRQINRYKSHAAELQDRINFLEGELDACRKSKVSGGSVGGSVSGTAGVTAPVAAMAATAVAAAAAPVSNQKDDLKVVEGIGPKIEELFNNAGIYSFAQLADAPVVKLKSILDNAGSRFQIHDPSTWSAQAALARDGKWDELKVWQDELNKGKE